MPDRCPWHSPYARSVRYRCAVLSKDFSAEHSMCLASSISEVVCCSLLPQGLIEDVRTTEPATQQFLSFKET